MDDDLKDLIAMVFYDKNTRSVLINITGFRNNLHGRDVSDWILETLNIDQLEFGEEKPTVH
jgi:hypothetical protein|tara:strand:- start:964 stop:1146 length:183 start_codon:yes stop_codon:yes gene_type:complete